LPTPRGAQINIQTAGQGAIGAEVQAAFLRDPEQAQRAIKLAVQLHQGGPSRAPPQVKGEAPAPRLPRCACLAAPAAALRASRRAMARPAPALTASRRRHPQA
jgi:hypothetical protein